MVTKTVWLPTVFFGYKHLLWCSAEHLHLHLHLVIWQTLLSKATYNWGVHKAINLEEAEVGLTGEI